MTFYKYVSKYIVYVYSLIYLISALCFIGFGVFMNHKNSWSGDIDEDLNTASETLIVVGLFLLAIAVIGVCGVFNDSTRLLSIFSTLLAVVVVAMFVLSGTAYVKRKEIEEYGFKVMNQSMTKYNQTGEDFWTMAWDYMQPDRRCCGLNKPQDWYIVNPSKQLPLSCCYVFRNGPNSCVPYDAWATGCFISVRSDIRQSRDDIIWTGVKFATVQFLVILFACYRRHTLINKYKKL
ncbi:tetraspanin-4-like isoform X2 [Adelges cooleyi]|uniref:tetraspanin-4-like isoform X1 n=1 Tax=Adelges cooleyi TaxID=133065 RepID=UPI0021800E9C|nr:tetraspanin-4-like isoform X1 [Adelges cooleyi]XP_050422965.1 tetraspanin-4-like isoform X2 [Adelges cooleyi]